MSEVFMTIHNDSRLYKDYFEWRNGFKNMVDTANRVMDQFGIESKRFSARKDRLAIEPTESDAEKFAKMLMADGQSFKKTSAPNKAWVDAMKDIKHMRKPQLFGYMPMSLLGCRWKEQLFHVGEILYCHIDSDGKAEVPDFATAIKGSEYYAVLEREDE